MMRARGLGISIMVLMIAMGLCLGGTKESAAADPALEPFLGQWLGTTIPGGQSRRTGALHIERRGGDGFSVTWTSFELVEDFPDVSVIGRARSLIFEPGPRPGLWRVVPDGNVVDGEACWAVIRDGRMTITTIALAEDDRLEQQIYERVLTSEGMTLIYRRLHDGVPVRTIEARFKRP